MFPRGNSMEGVETGRTRSYGAAAEYKSHLPDMRLCFQRQSQDAGVVQMRFLRTSGKRGRRGCDQHQRARTKLVSLWGESEKNAQAQVNSGRSKKLTPNQQQESTEVIIAGSKRDKEETVYEISDLAYHVLVLMVSAGITVEDVTRELEKRHVIDHKVKQERMQ